MEALVKEMGPALNEVSDSKESTKLLGEASKHISV